MFKRREYSWAAGPDPDLKCLSFIGRGGFGSVFKIRRESDQKVVARKILDPRGSPARLKAIEEEGEAVKTLIKSGTHQNLVTIIGHEWKQFIQPKTALLYVIDMELGELNLEDYIQSKFSIDPDVGLPLFEVWNIMVQITSGLSFLHTQKLIHCDLKPANIVKDLDSNPPVWKLVDFGCTTNGTQNRLVPTTGTLGTDLYLSPEMIRVQDFNNKVDTWSLGCILHELCTKTKAFEELESLYDYVGGKDVVPKIFDDGFHERQQSHRPNEKVLGFIKEIWDVAQSFPDIVDSLHHPNTTSSCAEINRLMAEMLNLDPKLRPTSKQIQAHSAVNMITSSLQSKEVRSQYLPEAKKYMLLQSLERLLSYLPPNYNLEHVPKPIREERWHMVIQISTLRYNDFDAVLERLARFVMVDAHEGRDIHSQVIKNIVGYDEPFLANAFEKSFLLPPLNLDRPYLWITGRNSSIRYVKRLGAGAIAEVYELYDETRQMPFARKVFDWHRPESDNEIRIAGKLAQLSHPNIVAILDHGFMGPESLYSIDMEFCNYDLSELMQSPERKLGGFDIFETCRIGRDVSCGLSELHRMGLVHRDIKPRNILFSERHNTWKIADFGLTSEGTSRRLLSTKYSRGTSSYRSPELLSNEGGLFNNKSDIWALGCVMYELTTGKPAFLSDFDVWRYRHEKSISLHVGDTIHSLYMPPLSPAVDLINSMLDPAPDRRPTAQKVVVALDMIMEREYNLSESLNFRTFGVSPLTERMDQGKLSEMGEGMLLDGRSTALAGLGEEGPETSTSMNSTANMDSGKTERDARTVRERADGKGSSGTSNYGDL